MPARETIIDNAACQSLYLHDEEGRLVTGAEDLVISPSGRSVFISAYDRRRVERETDSGVVETQGGIYRAELSDMIEAARLQVETIIDSRVSGGPMHPHGIDVWSNTEGQVHLFVINRRYQGEEHPQGRDIIQIFHVDEQAGKAVLAFTLPEEDRLCHPNDLTVVREQLVFVSNDRGACGGFDALWEDVWGLSRSRLFAYREGVYEAIGPTVAFANGVALLREHSDRITGLALSATRDRKIMIFDVKHGSEHLSDAEPVTLTLSAAPDNITVSAEGQLYIAAHPDLFHYALYRAELFGIDRAPSLVYRIHRASSGHWQQHAVFEDNGELISAATVALSVKGHLIMGSAYDDHLLVCSMESVKK